MGWGDLAREAMNKAVEAYKASIVLGERMQNLLESFRGMEGRLTSSQQDFERRLREMESRVARLEGRVDAALAEAYTKLLGSSAPSGIVEANDARPLGDGGDEVTRASRALSAPRSRRGK
jgi:predicted  nucleic acid-binding Zn-ribbon protein